MTKTSRRRESQWRITSQQSRGVRPCRPQPRLGAPGLLLINLRVRKPPQSQTPPVLPSSCRNERGSFQSGGAAGARGNTSEYEKHCTSRPPITHTQAEIKTGARFNLPSSFFLFFCGLFRHALLLDQPSIRTPWEELRCLFTQLSRRCTNCYPPPPLTRRKKERSLRFFTGGRHVAFARCFGCAEMAV